MKISIIAILISLSAIAYGQATAEYTTWPVVNGDTIEGVEGIDFITIYDPKEVFKEMLTEYLESRDSVEVHFNNGMFCFVSDYSGLCANRDHYRMEIQTPTFQGFINYVLNQKP